MGLGKLWPMGQTWLILFVNKVLLELQHAYSLTSYLQLPPHYSRVEYWDTDCIAYEVKNIYYLALQRKNLPFCAL